MKKLTDVFSGLFVTDKNVATADQYYWYYDESGEPIGIDKRISAREKALIELFHEPIRFSDLHQTHKRTWAQFLQQSGASLPLPPLENKATHVGFIFLRHTFDREAKEAFESLLGSFHRDFVLLFLGQSEGVILDFSSGNEIESEEIDDFLLAARMDFANQILFYRTRNYPLDATLPEVFQAEWALLGRNKTLKEGLIGAADLFLNELLLSGEITEHPAFKRWLKPLFELDPELLSVVRCYLENGFNVTTAAKKLHMHRNTFANKLERFTMETGWDVKKFNEATTAYLLIRLRTDGLS